MRITVIINILLALGCIWVSSCTKKADSPTPMNYMELKIAGQWHVAAQVDSTTTGDTVLTGYSSANTCNFTQTRYTVGGAPENWKQCTDATTGLSNGLIVAPGATGASVATFWYYDTLQHVLLINNSEFTVSKLTNDSLVLLHIGPAGRYFSYLMR